ncbi:MAG: response regulator [Spirochaetales bacterium]|nr:response regulator [Spirochaetales bacterium]
MSTVTRTIMVVDDEMIIRNSFVDYFEDHLWETLQADSGEDALKMLKEHSLDVLIVDVRMGGMDGNSFIRNAYEISGNAAFFICTGSPEYEVPDDLKTYPRVSKRLFKKPVQDLASFEKEIIKFLEELRKA